MSRRLERLSSLLREAIASLLQQEINDPRLPTMISITQVKISPDLAHAFVSVSTMGGEEEKEQAMKALENARGYIRHKLASRLSLRRIPQIHFLRDDSLEKGSQVLEILKQLGFQN